VDERASVRGDEGPGLGGAQRSYGRSLLWVGCVADRAASRAEQQQRVGAATTQLASSEYSMGIEWLL
jgi:hypothetical protein